MTTNVKNFIETNVELLDSNQFEFFISAYNGLTLIEQKLLVEALKAAQIDVEKAREDVLRYIITRVMEDIEREVTLYILIQRHLDGVLGYDSEFISDYILANTSEWDNRIERINGEEYVYPQEAI